MFNLTCCFEKHMHIYIYASCIELMLISQQVSSIEKYLLPHFLIKEVHFIYGPLLW
jgi:hypothetical protein